LLTLPRPAAVHVVVPCAQLKWNQPDETGGEHIGCYEVLVRPPPPTWEGLVPDEEVRVGYARGFFTSSPRATHISSPADARPCCCRAAPQGFALIYAGPERSFLLNKLGPAQRFSFKIRVSAVLPLVAGGCGASCAATDGSTCACAADATR
jgi:hypothetical protein